MTNTTAVAASEVIAAVQARIAKLIEFTASDMGADMWTQYESWQSYLAQTRTAATWKLTERSVVVSVTAPEGVFLHGNIADELLDCAAADLDAAGRVFGDEARIEGLAKGVSKFVW
jgi:hypothetical protein